MTLAQSSDRVLHRIVTNDGRSPHRRSRAVRSAAYAGNGTVDLVDSEPVAPPSGQVQIRVGFVGLCGTDLHIVHGHMDRRVRTPLVFGHEMSGTVEVVGPDVAGWSVGDLVTVMPLLWDGT